ncbi:hypothetical protein BJ508DRAFT_172631 [Ascobolus immersus RN42]|uniref:Uncharacterized protein n=1 Tax=Ascobolus immersus RN42 TaxID=1160509 RepID=A0A3N4HVK5_ASCIM|nr:hypothetical protein BJ508DRAFT_172631 [Ascobolus immersus RN42]
MASVGDIITIVHQVSRLRKRFRKGPEQYKEIRRTLSDLEAVVDTVWSLFLEGAKAGAGGDKGANMQSVRGKEKPGRPATAGSGNAGGYAEVGRKAIERLGRGYRSDQTVDYGSSAGRITEVDSDEEEESDKDDEDDETEDEDDNADTGPFNPDGAIGTSITYHINQCRMLLAEFEKKAQSWEDAANPHQSTTAGSGFARSFFKTYNASSKAVVASFTFSITDMKKFLDKVKANIDALKIYVDLGTARFHKRLEGKVDEIHRVVVKTAATQTEMFTVVHEIKNMTMGIQYMVSNSPHGPVETIRIMGAMGTMDDVPLMIGRSKDILSQALTHRLKNSQLGQLLGFSSVHIRPFIETQYFWECAKCGIDGPPLRSIFTQLLQPEDEVYYSYYLYPDVILVLEQAGHVEEAQKWKTISSHCIKYYMFWRFEITWTSSNTVKVGAVSAIRFHEPRRETLRLSYKRGDPVFSFLLAQLKTDTHGRHFVLKVINHPSHSNGQRNYKALYNIDFNDSNRVDATPLISFRSGPGRYPDRMNPQRPRYCANCGLPLIYFNSGWMPYSETRLEVTPEQKASLYYHHCH